MSDTASHPSQNPIRRGVAAVFLDHPASVDESYLEHMRFACGFAFWLGTAALAALVHAIIPALCKTTASRILKRLYERIESRSVTS